ncbi:MAG: hypothetical protein KA586_11385 [Candidatus Promineofilum sp.]|nr:hypothetical protein [Promineifilum sp.]
MIIRRILGLIMLLTGLTLLTLSLVGAYLASDALAGLADGLGQTLAMASHSLDAADDTLALARDSISDVDGGLATAVAATAGAAQTLNDSRPLLDNVAAVTTQEVPEAVEGIQAALPNMIEVAAVIDSTLTTLSSVGIDREIPLPFGGSIPLSFDLGIDYNPTTSFDESLRTFDTSLVGLPESLRGLEDDLSATNANLASLSSGLQATSDDLGKINTRISELGPLLDQYSALIEQIRALVTQIEAQLGPRLDMIRLGSIVLLIAVALSQLAPLYLGWELLTGRRDPTSDRPTFIVASEQTPIVVVETAEAPSTVVRPAGDPTPGIPDKEDHVQT